jgi:AhpC/TSA family
MGFRFYIIAIHVLIASSLRGQIPAQRLPAFKFFKLDQQPFTDRDIPDGKKTLFIFFDVDCDHCQHTIAGFDHSYKSFAQAKIYLVSLNSPVQMSLFMTTFGPHLKVQKNVVLLQDSLNQFIYKFQPIKYPSMFLYAADKKLLDYEDNEGTIFRLENAMNKK